MKKKRWIISGYSESEAEALAENVGISKLAARVLCARGLSDGDDAKSFLGAGEDCIGDPFLLDGMDDAVKTVRKAMDEGRRIAVYGDYDADGVTAASIVFRYLREKGVDCRYYIPDRLSEGYGINKDALKTLREDGVSLVITVDAGITAVDEVEYAKSIGLEMVITDHHECRDVLPDAAAVVDPRRPGSRYPFAELAGVGVAFKLICALSGTEHTRELLYRYSDIVAIGTVADVMQITGENRAIVGIGLDRIAHTENIGLRMLIKETGLEGRRIASSQIGFIIAPRINAAGRLGCADRALELLLTDDEQRAEMLAAFLCEQNRLRQDAENDIYLSVLERLQTEFVPGRDKMIVMWGENWHGGVIGIVASKISDRYSVPTILISLDGDVGRGSGRSVPGFNLFCALSENADLLEKYGGYELAAGLTVSRANLEKFRQAMLECASRCMDGLDLTPALSIDCAVSLSELSVNAVESLSVLEPFGAGNQQPVFCMNDVTVRHVVPISRDKHTRLTVEKDGFTLQAMLFGTAPADCPVVEGDTADIAFSPEINSYRGIRSVQLTAKDVRCAEKEARFDAERLAPYMRFKAGGELSASEAMALIPVRYEFVNVFRYIKANAYSGVLHADAGVLYRRIKRENRENFDIGRMMVCLSVFNEFNIFRIDETDGALTVRVMRTEGKADINGSRILASLMDIARRGDI